MILIKYEARNRNGSRNPQFYELLDSMDDPIIERINIGIDSNIYAEYSVFDVKALVCKQRGPFLRGISKEDIDNARSKLEEKTKFKLVPLSKIRDR